MSVAVSEWQHEQAFDHATASSEADLRMSERGIQLADFECRYCDQIGSDHAEDCPRQPKGQTVECKIEGCANEVATRKGVYGGLCTEHRAERQAARLPVVSNGHPARSDREHLEQVVERLYLRVSDALADAQTEVGELLRRDLVSKLEARGELAWHRGEHEE